jgi:hypothetical protein
MSLGMRALGAGCWPPWYSLVVRRSRPPSRCSRSLAPSRPVPPNHSPPSENTLATVYVDVSCPNPDAHRDSDFGQREIAGCECIWVPGCRIRG